MRILVGHNFYFYPGGEDAVAQADVSLLREAGHEVNFFSRRNPDFSQLSFAEKIRLSWDMPWRADAYREIKGLIDKFRPEIAHFHNIFYLLSPSVYQACREAGIPVVQSLHNFRLMCLNGLFYRDGVVCEECLGRGFAPGIRNRCFRNSRLLSYAMARTIEAHQRAVGFVDRYLVATEFTRRKYIEMGFPADKISVKPHFVFDPGYWEARGEYALCVARFSQEKGADVLLRAWKDLTGYPLKIMGEGPLAEKLRHMAETEGIKNVEFLGFLTGEKYLEQMRGAKFLIVPSVCYENFPRIVIEAFALGKPVLASRLGSLEEIVQDGVTGKHFSSGDEKDLARQVRWCFDHNDELISMGCRAREFYEKIGTPEKSLEALLDVYRITAGKVFG